MSFGRKEKQEKGSELKRGTKLAERKGGGKDHADVSFLRGVQRGGKRESNELAFHTVEFQSTVALHLVAFC